MAHGAHFAYSAFLPTPPGRAGADVWVESAHKMLPAMNQCACLCVGKNALVDREEVLRSLRSFQTTSPSYLLLGSLDYAHAYMRDKGESEMLRVNTLARRFEELVNLLPGFYSGINVPDMAARDPLKSWWTCPARAIRLAIKACCAGRASMWAADQKTCC